MTTTNERVAITPAEDATIIKRGEFTEIAIWRSEYNGQRQVSVAQRHPKRTGGYWSTRQPIVYDAELSAAFMKQAIGHTHVVTNLVDYDMDVQEALDCPRTFYDGDTLMVENTFEPDVRARLSALGHKVEEAVHPFGGGQMALINWDEGTFVAGSEPRKDGLAIAY